MMVTYLLPGIVWLVVFVAPQPCSLQTLLLIKSTWVSLLLLQASLHPCRPGDWCSVVAG